MRRIYGTPAVHPLANTPRVFASDVPFDPFSAEHLHGPNGLIGTPSGGSLRAGICKASPPTPGMPPRSSPSRSGTQPASPGPEPGGRSRGRARVIRSKRPEWEFLPLDDLDRRTHGGGGPEGLELGLIASDIQRATLDAQQRLSNDVRTLEMTNAAIHQMNGRLLPVLEGVTGQSYGEDQRPGKRGGRTRRATPCRRRASYVQTRDRPVRRSPFQPIPTLVARSAPSCFGAGTTVRTREGSWPIETIRVGDQVLAQDVRTGGPELPARPGRLPQPARHDAPGLARRRGDRRHRHPPLLEGGARLGHGPRPQGRRHDPHPRRRGAGRRPSSRRDPAGLQPRSGRGHNFFAGEQGALVHDNSLVRPTPEPFDAAPDLAAVAPAASPRWRHPRSIRRARPGISSRRRPAMSGVRRSEAPKGKREFVYFVEVCALHKM